MVLRRGGHDQNYQNQLFLFLEAQRCFKHYKKIQIISGNILFGNPRISELEKFEMCVPGLLKLWNWKIIFEI